MKYFFVDPFNHSELPTRITIRGSDARHMKNALRLIAGDMIGLFDGTGTEYRARIDAFSGAAVEVTVLSRSSEEKTPGIQLEISQALLKDRKMDDIIRQLTELGVIRFMPFVSSRSVPKLDKKRMHSRVQRWEKITKESLKQCRRGYAMAIHRIGSFSTVLDHASKSDLKLVFWEDATEPISSIVENLKKSGVKRISAVLGPEGGFTTEEIRNAEEAGYSIASLGPRILRAETAAVAAAVLLQYLFGDMG